MVTSHAEFERTFGNGQPLELPNEGPAVHYLWQSVRAFFAQGGQRLYAVRISNADYEAGLKTFESVPDISIVAAPGAVGDPLAAMRLLIAHAERMRYRFAILDGGERQSVSDVRALRAKLDSRHAALYFPWVRVLDPISRKEIHLPPSGFVAGIYATTTSPDRSAKLQPM